MDIRLTDYDIDLTNGDLSWVTEQEAIAQDITMRLRTWLGETPYDKSVGVPYLQVIFVPGTPRAAVQLVLEQQVLKTPGVTGVSLDIVINGLTRELSVTGKAQSIRGEVDFTFQLKQ